MLDIHSRIHNDNNVSSLSSISLSSRNPGRKPGRVFMRVVGWIGKGKAGLYTHKKSCGRWALSLYLVKSYTTPREDVADSQLNE